MIRDKQLIKNGDKVVITHGDEKIYAQGLSNSIKVEIIKAATQIAGSSESLDEADFSKGKILLDTHICASCQNCLVVCPHDIWELAPGEEKQTIINKVKAERCTLDMQCVEACPTGAIEIIPK